MQMNAPGATEHVAKRFCSWLRVVLDAILKHKKDPTTVEAHRRSGHYKFQHGLTPEEVVNRSD